MADHGSSALDAAPSRYGSSVEDDTPESGADGSEGAGRGLEDGEVTEVTQASTDGVDEEASDAEEAPEDAVSEVTKVAADEASAKSFEETPGEEGVSSDGHAKRESSIVTVGESADTNDTKEEGKEEGKEEVKEEVKEESKVCTGAGALDVRGEAVDSLPEPVEVPERIRIIREISALVDSKDYDAATAMLLPLVREEMCTARFVERPLRSSVGEGSSDGTDEGDEDSRSEHAEKKEDAKEDVKEDPFDMVCASVVCPLTVGERTVEADETVRDVLFAFADLAARGVHLNSSSLLSALSRVLNPALPVYKGHSSGVSSEQFKALVHEQCPEAEGGSVRVVMSPSRATSDISIHFLLLVNRIANAGFFEDVVEVMELCAPPLAVVRELLRPLTYLEKYLSLSFVSEYLPRLSDAVFDRLLVITDKDLTRLEKQEFHEASAIMQRLLRRVMDGRAISRRIDEFNLRVGLRSMGSSALERRLKGIRLVKKQVERALPVREERRLDRILRGIASSVGIGGSSASSSTSSSSSSSVATSASVGPEHGVEHTEKNIKRLDPQFLLDWLEEHEIVKKIVHDKAHSEEIKQGVSIVSFLALHNRLSDDVIQVLLHYSIGAHESVQRVVYDALVMLASKLSDEAVQMIWAHIQAIPMKDMDPEILQFLWGFIQEIGFTSAASSSSASSSSSNESASENKKASNCAFGLDIMWLLIQEDAGVPPAVSTAALEYFFKLLKVNAAVRAKYIVLCVEQLEAHKSGKECLQLLYWIAEMHPKKKKRKHHSMSSLLAHWDNKHGLVSLVIRDIEHLASHAAGEDGGAMSVETVMSEIQARLEYLDKIFSNSSLSPTQEQLDVLWSLFVASPFTGAREQTAPMLFKWLENARVGDAPNLISIAPKVGEHLFLERLCNMKLESLSVAEYTVVERFFAAVNEARNHVRKEPRNNRTFWYAVTNRLLGLEALWSVILSAEDEEVGRRATRFLNALFQVSPADETAAHGRVRARAQAQLRGGHIAIGIEHLTTATSEEPIDTLRATRCIALLKSFAEGFTSDEAPSSASEEVPIVIKLDFGPPFIIKMNRKDTAGMLRQRIASFLRKPMSFYRVLYGTTELRDSERTLEELQLRDGDRFIVQLREVNDNNSKTVVIKQPTFDERIEEYSLRSLIANTLDVMLSSVGLNELAHPYLSLNTAMPRSIRRCRDLPEDNGKRVMVNEQHFRVLYELLDCANRGVASQVAELLGILPVNEHMIGSFEKLESLEENWSRWLGSESTFKLSYTLQVIDELIAHGASEEWRDSFVARGGVTKLVGMLMDKRWDAHDKSSDDTSEESAEKLACCELLVRVINRVLVPSSGSVEFGAGLDTDEESSKRTERAFSHADIDGTSLMERLVSLSRRAARHIEDSLTALFMESLTLMLLCVRHNASLMSKIYGDAEPDWIWDCLVATPQPPIRKSTGKLLAKIAESSSSESENTIIQLFEVMRTLLPRTSEYTENSAYFYTFLEKLCVVSCRGDVTSAIEEALEAVVVDVILLLRKHVVAEETVTGSPQRTDYTFAGLCEVLAAIVARRHRLRALALAHEAALISYLTVEALFALPCTDDPNPPPCKSARSRSAAMMLLAALVSSDPAEYCRLARIVMEEISRLGDRKSGSGQPLLLGRESHGYMGLRNLGATCYMNSLVQQLYMVPQFRRGIIGVEYEVKLDEESADSARALENAKADDVLYQMQILFSSLQEGMKRYHDTSAFANSYREPNGDPVNVKVQMDANEFFNGLFERLEQKLKGTSREKLLDELFGGEFTNQIISRECEHRSEREEHFFTVGVEIKNKPTLIDSFDLFVEGEMLSGDNKYFCERCGNGVNALKRICLSSLPPILLVHLKRFEFDFMTMRQKKLNDHCKFPMDLDLFPYTKEGLARSEIEEDDSLSEEEKAEKLAALEPPRERGYYQYELVGIVIHTGTTDLGHYYSFIKERVPLQGSSQRWFEFNDTTVSAFDTARIPAACFGGTEESSVWNAERQCHVKQTRTIANNAYILVYQRKGWEGEPDPGGKAACTAEGATQSEDIVDEADEDRHEIVACPKVPVQKHLLETVWDTNRAFVRERHVFNDGFARFMWRLVNVHDPAVDEGSTDVTGPLVDPDDELGERRLMTLEFALLYLTRVYWRAKGNSLFPAWTRRMQLILRASLPGCRWLASQLARSRQLVLHFFFTCPAEGIRRAYLQLVMSVLRLLCPMERDRYAEMDDLTGAEHAMQVLMAWQKVADAMAKGLVGVSLIQQLYKRMSECKLHGPRSAQYFELLEEIVGLGIEERDFLLHRGLVQKTLNCMLATGEFAPQSKSTSSAATSSGPPLPPPAPSAMRYSNVPTSPPIRLLLKLVSEMQWPGDPACSARVEHLAAEAHEPDLGAQLVPPEAVELFLSTPFLSKLCRDCSSAELRKSMIIEIARHSRSRSKRIADVLGELMAKSKLETLTRQYLGCVGVLQGIDDAVQHLRVDDTLRVVMSSICATKTVAIVDVFVEWYTGAAEKNAAVRRWDAKNRELMKAKFEAGGIELGGLD